MYNDIEFHNIVHGFVSRYNNLTICTHIHNIFKVNLYSKLIFLVVPTYFQITYFLIIFIYFSIINLIGVYEIHSSRLKFKSYYILIKYLQGFPETFILNSFKNCKERISVNI